MVFECSVIVRAALVAPIIISLALGHSGIAWSASYPYPRNVGPLIKAELGHAAQFAPLLDLNLYFLVSKQTTANHHGSVDSRLTIIARLFCL
jgi:hypothetical protein